MKPRAWTTEEVKDQFLSQLAINAKYWDSQDMPCSEKISGAIFSTLSLLDGCTNLPGFAVVAQPHKDDKQYCLENKQNYYEKASLANDIAGGLHEVWHQYAINVGLERKQNASRNQNP